MTTMTHGSDGGQHATDANGADIDWSVALRDRGLRVTRQRVAVLQALSEHPHATVETLHARARDELPTLTAQAVYLMLDGLVAAGLVRRFDAPRQPARFETRVNDNHHHLLCTVCARIVDIDCAVGAAPCLEPTGEHGFEIEAADVIFRGRCAECVAEAASPAPS